MLHLELESACYYTYMAIPISALQRNAAEVVRRIAASNVSEEITDRGRVVAVLSPPSQAIGIDRLRKAGVTHAAVPGALVEVVTSGEALPHVGLTDALVELRDTDR